MSLVLCASLTGAHAQPAITVKELGGVAAKPQDEATVLADRIWTAFGGSALARLLPKVDD
jgi:hypothetical protein